MSVDSFMKFSGVDGESVDSEHKGEIDVLSWSWACTQPGTTHTGGGGGTGKVEVHNLEFTKYADKATPVLFEHCCSGKHIPEALLTVRKAGENPLEYLVIKMEKVLISSYSTGGSTGDDRLTENIGLDFAKVEVTYTPQKDDGSGDAAITNTWNIEENCK